MAAVQEMLAVVLLTLWRVLPGREQPSQAASSPRRATGQVVQALLAKRAVPEQALALLVINQPGVVLSLWVEAVGAVREQPMSAMQVVRFKVRD
jgi:hypothetical protein